MKRSPMRSRFRNTGPSDEVVAIVHRRDADCCAFCAMRVFGLRGLDYSVHHRMARKGGGTTRPFINLPGNLVLLHGHGSVGCHHKVEKLGSWSSDHGFKVREGCRLPAEVPIDHALHGEVYLLDDGTWEAA